MHNISSSPSQAGTTLPRYNIYGIIHKAIRAFLCDTLMTLASMDTQDEQEVARSLAQLRELIAYCDSHLQHENTFVHPAMEARRPGSSSHIAAEHEEHLAAFHELRHLADAVEYSSGAAREAAATQLHLSFALFVAENLAHMNIEESVNNAVLQATHTDEELLAIEHAIVATIAPQEMMLGMRWMIPAMNATERAQQLGGMRQGAPAPVFDAVLDIARANLAGRDWDKLAQALGLPVRLAA